MNTVLAGERSQAGLDVELLAEPLQGGALVADYLAGAPGVAPFYTGHPGDIEAYRRKAADVERRLDARARQRVADAITPLGDAAERLQRILAGDGFFVTTGQQPALFGGPLYTLYKALAAIRSADLLERHLGRPVLALFWVGADDHDWEEANHVSVLDGQGYVARIEVGSAVDAPPVPLSERAWGRGMETAVDRMVALLPQTPFAGEVAHHLRTEYTPDATVEAAFTSTLAWLLHDRRIALVSSAHPAVRRAAVPVMMREASNAAAHFEALRRQTDLLAAAGYPTQVALAADASNLMQQDERGRDRLMRTERGWVTRREGQPSTERALLGKIEAQPERFSPNVLLRPVVENAVFPTIAYVAGPGELRYFAQIGCLFAAHDVLPPVVVPRGSVTIVEARVRRLLDRLQLAHTDVRQPFDRLLTTLARRDVPPAAAAALDTLRDAIGAAYSQLVEATESIDPTLRGPLTAARNRSLMQANDAERRMLRQIKRRDSARSAQLARAAASLFPGAAPQERVLNALPYVARYGRGLVAELERVLAPIETAPSTWSGPECGG